MGDETILPPVDKFYEWLFELQDMARDNANRVSGKEPRAHWLGIAQGVEYIRERFEDEFIALMDTQEFEIVLDDEE